MNAKPKRKKEKRYHRIERSMAASGGDFSCRMPMLRKWRLNSKRGHAESPSPEIGDRETKAS